MKLDELYQEVILDHFKRPRCHGSLPQATAQYTLFNPLCGDQVDLNVLLKEGKIADLAFSGHGCSISQASASMLAELSKDRSVKEVRELCEHFKQMMRGEVAVDQLSEKLGDAVSLEGVRKFPARVKCALLAWEAMQKCLENDVVK